MADCGNEKAGLGAFAKSQAKYGTTSKLTVSNETFLKHTLAKGDTLQGISLKYNVPVQELRRANNTWMNDSLFLREYVLIPVGMSPMQAKKNFALNGDVRPKESLDPSVKQEIITRRDLNKLAKTHTMSSSCAKSDERIQQNALSAKDFLSKFDNSLAQIKDNIQKLEDKSQLPDDQHNPLVLLPNKKSSRFYSLHNRRSMDLSDDSDSSREPELAFKSSRSSRKIRDSLEKLEREQDDIFQL